MALNPQEFQQLQKRLGGAGDVTQTTQDTQSVEQPGYLKRVGQQYMGIAKNVISDVTRPDQSRTKGASFLETAKQVGEAGLRTVGNVAKAAFTPIMEAPGIKQATEAVGGVLAKTPAMQKFQEWSTRHPEASKDIMATLDIAGLFGGKAAAGAAEKGVVRAGKAVGEKVSGIASATVKTGEKVLAKGKSALGPPVPNVQQAVGQVLQGKAGDIKAGLRGLKEVDTAGVKSYDDLLGRTGDSIKRLSEQVDQTLDNTTPVKMNDLMLSGKTKAGQSVKVDYVDRALTHLKEFYESSGDDIAAKNIDETLDRAKQVGLTRQEVNNISRVYGSEFGEKAFSKIGEPLTSVNAQKFENTRKFLKETARKGLNGETARDLDKSISSLYKIQTLVKKNAAAVNKLSQKIQERGLLEKIGYKAAKVADVLSGGSLRGILGGLLPRGVGYKVMNALDLEEVLSRNLQVIQKALKAGDPEIIKLLKTKVGPNP